jgi:hypothetical protein
MTSVSFQANRLTRSLCLQESDLIFGMMIRRWVSHSGNQGMAINTVWSIDLGKSSLKAVRLRRSQGNVEIVAVDKVDYPLGDGGEDTAALGSPEPDSLQRRLAEINAPNCIDCHSLIP